MNKKSWKLVGPVCLALSVVVILAGIVMSFMPKDTGVGEKAPDTAVTAQGTGAGLLGDVVVEVTADQDKIYKIAVVEQNETPELGGVAAEKIPAAIYEAQNINVDAVAGATVTSNAIKDAVTAALVEAGLDPAPFGGEVKSEEPAEEKEAVDPNGDNVVSASDIGFGGEVTAILAMADDGSIEAVTLVGDNETPNVGGAALATLEEQVMEVQGAEIDGVAGATLTSEGVRAAVAKALAIANGEAEEAAKPADGSKFVPGTYEGAAKGFGGDVVVSVVVDANEIKSIEVVDQHETENIGEFAVDAQPVKMVENQTCNIDALAGATVTSNAIKNAVSKALSEAGCDISALPVVEEKELPADQKEEKTEEVDIVIVGAGGAGMTAAINATQAGKKVLIVEKMPYVGGNSTKATGGMNAAETKYQDAKEFTEADGVENQLAAAAEKYADNETITKLAAIVADQWAEYQANPEGYFDTVELMELDTIIGGKGINDPALVETMCRNTNASIEWLDSIEAPLPKVSFSGGASVSRIHSPEDGSGVGAYLVTQFRRVLEEMDIPVLYNTKATSIIMEDGKAVGIKAESKDSLYTINAKAVVITSGGYGANMDMICEYKPDLEGSVTTNAPGATGDGIVMAQEVGAAVRDMDKIQLHPTVEQSTSMLITEGVRGDGAILVNKDGVRFTNEMLTRDAVSAAELEQPDSFAYVIFDQKLREGLKATEKYIKTGIVTEGATIEELAEKLDIDPAVLAQTLADWNVCVANKDDPEFGRATGMGEDLSVAPYYAIKIAPGIHHTMGGICINPDTNVLNEDGEVIEGLFAAGEVTGGVHGGNRLGGTAVCDFVVFGRIAGNNAAAYCD